MERLKNSATEAQPQHLTPFTSMGSLGKIEGPSQEEIEFMNEVENLGLNLSAPQKAFLRIVIRLKEEGEALNERFKGLEEEVNIEEAEGLDITTALALLSDEAFLLETIRAWGEFYLGFEKDGGGRFGVYKLFLIKLVREKIYGSTFDISKVDIDPRLVKLIESVTMKSELSPGEIRDYWEKRFELNKEEYQALFETLEGYDASSLFPPDNQLCPLTGLVADVNYYDYDYCSYNVHHSAVKDFLKLRFKHFGEPSPEEGMGLGISVSY